MFNSPAITAIIIAIFAALSFTGGVVVSDWRNGAEMQRLKSQNAVLLAANEKCVGDVEDACAGVKQVTDALAEKSRATEDAMQKAKAEATQTPGAGG